jgi:hypothetical protein
MLLKMSFTVVGLWFIDREILSNIFYVFNQKFQFSEIFILSLLGFIGYVLIEDSFHGGVVCHQI